MSKVVMPGSRKIGVKAGLADRLRVCVEIAPKHIWKTLVKHDIVRKGPVIKKGHSMGKVLIELIEDEEVGDEVVVVLKKSCSGHEWREETVFSVSVMVDDHVCEEGIELTPKSEFQPDHNKWTLDTVEEHLIDHVDETLRYRLPDHLHDIVRKEVEVMQG